MPRPYLSATAAAVLLALTAACSQTPEYLRPAAPVPGQWPEPTAAVAPLPDWKGFYQDARLQVLINTALEHNRDLRVAAARVAEARALYGVQQADRLPTLNLGAGESASRLPGDLASSGQPMISRRYDVNLGITAFELDFWGRVASLREAALASYLASEQAQRAFRLSLVADVADTYLTGLELEQRLALAGQTLVSREESRRLIARRREVGLAGDLDYLAADAAYQAASAEVAALDRQRAAAANALRLLVGQLPGDLPPAVPLAAQVLPEPAPGLPAEVLLRRPDVLAAEQSLIAANAHVGAARAAFFPRIALTAAFGTASRELGGLFESGSRAWSFQPSLSLPLFDGGRTRANADLAEARQVIAVAQYEKAVQQAFREVADLLAARQQLARQLSSQEAGAEAQAQRLRIVEARYQGGIASYLELLDAQRDHVAARQAAVQLRRQWLSAASQLYKALGGG
jgi:multidrug efflux system outer membrane protein